MRACSAKENDKLKFEFMTQELALAVDGMGEMAYNKKKGGGDMLDFENLQKYRENDRIEAKEALGGLPESIWETYSAFANTDGGVILLGVEELPDKSLHALDILDPQWLIEDFWSLIRNPAIVSANILRQEHVQVHTLEGKRIVAITVPKADACQRPVYIYGELYRGSYRRCGEADLRCTREEIDTMLEEGREQNASNDRS